jgi:hypothetical protein
MIAPVVPAACPIWRSAMGHRSHSEAVCKVSQLRKSRPCEPPKRPDCAAEWSLTWRADGNGDGNDGKQPRPQVAFGQSCPDQKIVRSEITAGNVRDTGHSVSMPPTWARKAGTFPDAA